MIIIKNRLSKRKELQYFITDFAIEIGMKADKERFNKAWHKLWCRITRLKLFEDDNHDDNIKMPPKKKFKVNLKIKKIIKGKPSK